jgi:oxygen-independent coproporphyrinogen-3 oxidase
VDLQRVKTVVTPTSLYIHVPFCLRRCSYCDFAVEPTRRPPIAVWLDSVEAELAGLAHEQGWDQPLRLETLYIGGGTPSLMGAGAMAELRTRIERHATLATGLEWTAEANPETLSSELARDWAQAGVNRISIGVQTFHEPALKWMGRLHGADGPARAMDAAREAGFDNLSVDLIFALPDRLGRDWSRDIDLALDLEPQHVSLYGLSAEAATPLGRWVREGREQMVEDDVYASQYRLAAERLPAAGFVHYEVSNFGLPGRESRHNSVYWTGAPYIGLGPGAHSFLPPVRRWNERSWEAYRARVAEGGLAVVESEALDAAAERLEAIWLGMRTTEGYRPARWDAGMVRLAADWEKEGWATSSNETLRLTTEGWLLLDKLAVELDKAAP